MRMGESSISLAFSKPAKIYSHLPRSLTVPLKCINILVHWNILEGIAEQHWLDHSCTFKNVFSQKNVPKKPIFVQRSFLTCSKRSHPESC